MPLKIDPDKARSQAQPANKLDAQADAFSIRDANKRQENTARWQEEDSDLLAAAQMRNQPQQAGKKQKKKSAEEAEEYPPRLDTTQMPGQKKSSPLLKVLVVLLILAILGAAAYFVLIKDGGIFGAEQSQELTAVSSVTLTAGMTFEQFSKQMKAYCQNDQAYSSFMEALLDEKIMGKYAMFNGLAGMLSGEEIVLYLPTGTVISEPITSDNAVQSAEKLFSARSAKFSSLSPLSSHEFFRALKSAAYIEQNASYDEDKPILAAIIAKNATYLSEPYQLCCVSDASLDAALAPADTEYDMYEKSSSGGLAFFIYKADD